MMSDIPEDFEHDERDHPHDHGGCLCDHPPTEAEATPDDELPEATGGVAQPAKRRGRRATKTAV